MYFRPDVDTRARAHTWAIADRMMPVGDVHHLDDLADGDGLVGVDGEGGVLLALEQVHQLVLHLGEGHGLLGSVDVVGEAVLAPVLDGDAHRGLGAHLAGALGEQELEGVGIDQGGSHQEEDQQQEHDVRHRGHRDVGIRLGDTLEGHLILL